MNEFIKRLAAAQQSLYGLAFLGPQLNVNDWQDRLTISHAQLASLANTARSLNSSSSLPSSITTIEPYAVQTQAELIPQAFLRTKMIPEMEQVIMGTVEDEEVETETPESETPAKVGSQLLPLTGDDSCAIYDSHALQCARFLQAELQTIRLNQRYRFEVEQVATPTTGTSKRLAVDKMEFDEIRRSQEHLMYSLLKFENCGTTIGTATSR